jgi:uroporphyrinogen decarboxylase
MMFANPDLYSALLEKITDCTSLYLKAQAAAGAQALQIFDSWAGVLAPVDFERFALPYVQRIIAELRQSTDVPIIYFANNGATLLDLSKTSGADVLGLDWRVDIGRAVEQIGPNFSVQGNLDPVALLLPEKQLRARVAKILEGGSKARGHICNLGHGIHQFTPPAQAKIFIDAVHELSGKGS